MVVVRTACEMFEDLPLSAVVLVHSQHAFLVYCLPFLGYALRCEESLNEKITYSFNCLWKFGGRYLELVIGFIIFGVGVVHS